MFSCKFCEISKNSFFTEHFGATASEGLNEDSSSGWILSEAATEGVLLKKGALENLYWKTLVPESIFNKVAGY